jgi:predicted MFS family arabinose efflux permease
VDTSSPEPQVAPRRDIARPLTALFVAELVSTTGSEMAAVALPWFVLITSGSAARMGLVMAAEFLGMTVCGIPSGHAASALGPRRTLLVSDLARAGLVALIPILHWADALSFPVLLAIGFSVGAFFPAYSSSQLLVIADVVGDDEVRMTRVGGVFGSLNETASFVGPAVGGLLVALIGAPNVLVVDVATFLVAFVLVAAFVPRAPKPPPEHLEGGVSEGLRWIRRNRPLRWRVAGLMVVEVAFTAMVATLPVAALHRYGGSVRVAGWLLAAYGAGSVAGELISTRARAVSDRTATFAILGLAASTWPLVFVLPAWAVALAVAANGVCSGLFFPRFFSALTIRTPERLRARVTTSVQTLLSATGPLGFVGAGFILHATGSVTAGFVLVAASATVGAVIVAIGGAADAPAEVAPGT